MIRGDINRILTQKEDDWGRYEIKTADKKILAVGIIPEASVGMTVLIEGNMVTNEYGKQFKITSVLSTENDSFSGVRRFLSDGYIKGIGLSKANSIISVFGKKSADLFDTDEGLRKLATIKGFSDKVIKTAVESYNENKKYKDIVIFLNGCGTKHQVETIYEKYKDEALKVLKKNPYRLQMDLDGFGFKKADSIALASGIKLDSIERVMAGIKFTIEEAMTKNGHCFLTVPEIKEQVTTLLVPMPKFEDISDKVAENAAEKWPDTVTLMTHNPSEKTMSEFATIMETRANIENELSDALSMAIEEGSFVNRDGNIYIKTMDKKEAGVAEMAIEMLSKNPVRYISKEKIEKCITDVEARKTKELNENGIQGEFKVTEEQKNAVYLASMHRLSIISGGPGRGKTAISEIVAHTFLSAGKSYNKEDIIMLAPTGRAAQRITESTGYSSMTAQRAIAQCKKGELPPVGKLILVDEFSMTDIYLAYDIFKYAKDCNLIIVGDVDQIASVGPGKVLRDLIDCGKIPCILLKQGHRNSGTIAKNSDLINTGCKLDSYTYDNAFIYIPSPAASSLADVMINDYIAKINEYGITNVMLCAAMKDRGYVAVNKLNKILQDKLTKGNKEAIFGNRVFRLGDRVMQIKNDYDFIKLDANKNKIYGVFNGERGTIAKIDYDDENRTYKMVVRFDDDTYGGYSKASIENLTLAYATTLHKCQGSEAKCMMMAYTFGDYMLLNRSLFYTGETRAKKEFRFYGEEKFMHGKNVSAFDIAVGKIDDIKRNTGLKERIIELSR